MAVPSFPQSQQLSLQPHWEQKGAPRHQVITEPQKGQVTCSLPCHFLKPFLICPLDFGSLFFLLTSGSRTLKFATLAPPRLGFNEIPNQMSLTHPTSV